jgi:hypothetical protein
MKKCRSSSYVVVVHSSDGSRPSITITFLLDLHTCVLGFFPFPTFFETLLHRPVAFPFAQFVQPGGAE